MTEENEKNKLDALVKNFFEQIGVSTDEIDETIKLAEETEDSRATFILRAEEELPEEPPTEMLRKRITLLEQKLKEKNELVVKLQLVVSKMKGQIRGFEKQIAPALIKAIHSYRQKNIELENTIKKLRKYISDLKSIW